MPLPLTHLHLHTPDVRRSVAFYEEHLGLTVKADWGTIVFLDDGRGFDLAIMQDENPGAMPKWFHFGCRLENASAVKDAYDRMKAAGVTIARDYEAFEEGYVTFCIDDPDGYGIEIYYDPTLAGDS